MPCQSVTIPVPKEPSLSLVSMDATTDVNYVGVSFTVENTGNGEGTGEFEVSINLDRSSRKDYIENVSVTVPPGEQRSSTIEFDTNLEEERAAEVCVTPA